MIDNEECFGYRKGGKYGECAVLTHGDCDGCRFMKTKEEYFENLDKYPPDNKKFIAKVACSE